MQIAKVVPKVSASGEGIFDYAIPPQLLPDIKIGVLVLVPFHGRKVEGIIIDIKKSSPLPNLKPIFSIIDSVPAVDEIHIKLARWMSDYYITPFSKCLFEMVVPPAKRTIKKMPVILLASRNKITNSFSKKYLTVADFKVRLKFYLKAIEKTIARGKQVIILVPDLSLIPYFTRFLKNNISALHAGLTKTQRWQEWNRIRQGEAEVIIGSNSALFSPVRNLGLVIVDQEENETYKNGQSPRFHAVKTACVLCRLSGAALILGSVTPSVENYFNALKDKYLFQSAPKNNHTAIVDMNFEKQILSLPLKEKIAECLQQNKKILLFLNRKGDGSNFGCADCHWIMPCPQCGLPLRPSNDRGVCFNCEQNFVLPEQCPHCHGYNLKSGGLSTHKLEKVVKSLFEHVKTTVIEKGESIASNWEIAIVTNFALKFDFPPIELVAIIDADQGMSLPGYRAAERNFQGLFKFLRLAKEGIIQTHFPDNPFIAALGKLDYQKFYNYEIETRKKTDFPPFSRLIKLTYRHKVENETKKEAINVSRDLTSKFSRLIVMGPFPPFIPRQRNYHFQDIIIKYNKPLEKNLPVFLRSLPKGWTVDVDPYDLI